jgi:hypothetical protein
MRPLALVLVLAVTACDSKRSASPPPPVPKVEATPSSDSPSPKRAAPPARRTWTRPLIPPARSTTMDAWNHAEAVKTAAAWDAVADAYVEERSACDDDCLDVAYTVVLARKNALLAEPIEPPPGTDPVPLPPRVQAVVDALDAYVAMAPSDDPDMPGMKFLAANALRKWRQPDALVRLEDVLRGHRDHETAEYAANILLDALLTAGRAAEVEALVDELLADAAFLAGKDELRATLERIRAIIAQQSP